MKSVTTDKLRFLAIHPNVELYGSDRSFANSVEAIAGTSQNADMAIILPCAGPILTLPVFANATVHFKNMWILRRKDMTTPRIIHFCARGPWAVVRALRALARHDLTYINSITPLDYILATCLTRRKSIIHVREIPMGREMQFFRQLLILSRSDVIFNSAATRAAFSLPPHRDAKSHVVYNGAPTPPTTLKEGLNNERPIRVLMIGRLNSWKGQEVLVEALAGMNASQREKFHVRIIGSVFANQDHFRARIFDAVVSAGLEMQVEMEPFKDDPSDEFAWADVAVVPSTKPEPFGRVAIEAMSFGAAVIATAHGGVIEIVAEGETGLLVDPGDAKALAAALLAYIEDRSLLERHGFAGRERFERLFTNEASNAALADVVRSIVDL